jgi:prolyl-tRNA synthetase
MRASHYLLSTLKESPSDAEVISHQLMLRAGLIRQLASGLYTWLPTGLRVLKKIEAVVREEMNRAGALEIAMPLVQPAELWRETGRWEQYGPELLRLSDRHQRSFVLGPTHEELVTHLMRSEILSFKQLPLNLYQIQTKFRDETRPRFGVMRAREFLMKDSYSFHTTAESLQQTYEEMFQTYYRIFTRLGLNFRAVQADSGAIGGHYSHEFHVLAKSGEDQIAFSTHSDYAANVELAEAIAPPPADTTSLQPLCQRSVSKVHDLSAVAQALELPLTALVKTLVVRGADPQQPWIALLLRADHQLNPIKAEKLVEVALPLTTATAEELHTLFGVTAHCLGPVQLSMPIIADRTVATLCNFAAGANSEGLYHVGLQWQRDLPLPKVADLRNVVAGDASPDGQGILQIKRGIEVGHIFQLGSQYSEAMQLLIQRESGERQPLLMGCYGIGISRMVAAAIEQQHDDQGICWPDGLAPFQIALLPINVQKTPALRALSENLYYELQQAGFEVLLDDRQVRPGVMFSDMELIGIPWRVILSEQLLQQQQVEFQQRNSKKTQQLPITQVVAFLKDLIVG